MIHKTFTNFSKGKSVILSPTILMHVEFIEIPYDDEITT